MGESQRGVVMCRIVIEEGLGDVGREAEELEEEVEGARAYL